jgi:hypothetical protein
MPGKSYFNRNAARELNTNGSKQYALKNIQLIAVAHNLKTTLKLFSFTQCG